VSFRSCGAIHGFADSGDTGSIPSGGAGGRHLDAVPLDPLVAAVAGGVPAAAVVVYAGLLVFDAVRADRAGDVA
jgi:hypothetical protein